MAWQYGPKEFHKNSERIQELQSHVKMLNEISEFYLKQIDVLDVSIKSHLSKIEDLKEEQNQC